MNVITAGTIRSITKELTKSTTVSTFIIEFTTIAVVTPTIYVVIDFLRQDPSLRCGLFGKMQSADTKIPAIHPTQTRMSTKNMAIPYQKTSPNNASAKQPLPPELLSFRIGYPPQKLFAKIVYHNQQTFSILIFKMFIKAVIFISI